MPVLKPLVSICYKAVYTLAKVSVIMPSIVTCDSTCPDHLGRCNTDRIISISCQAAQGGIGKYSSDCHASL